MNETFSTTLLMCFDFPATTQCHCALFYIVFQSSLVLHSANPADCTSVGTLHVVEYFKIITTFFVEYNLLSLG